MVDGHVDVVIVGAGLSGICAAHYLRTRCPQRTFEVLEARERLGGTWDLFRYPGIRSDSDMYTLGFSFRPWRDPKAIADGPAILAYLEQTAAVEGLDGRIRFGERVERVAWSEGRWTVHTKRTDGTEAQLTCGFLWVCSGYYRYDRGYTPELPGIEAFGGQIVHPQHWPQDLDVGGKRVAVLGSGATAMTLVPELAKLGAAVTMVQRSPTYVIEGPSVDPAAEWLKRRLPARAAHRAIRWKNIGIGMAGVQFCRRFPARARRGLVGAVRAAIGTELDVETHFQPRYDPWDQRLCLLPDGDLFAAVRAGQVEVVTDTLQTCTERGLRMASGTEVEADILVTATGLELQFFGGASVSVDGQQIDLSTTRIYRGCMLSDVPNAAFVMGYTQASWTLKAELVCRFVCRVLRHMDTHGHTVCCPRRTDPGIADRPAMNLSSGYFQRARDRMPTQGSRAPWRLRQTYVVDRLAYRTARIDDGVLELR